uniref:Uncharacterized protein n=1 Tax=Mustela putorius furo TaxID=9669 RepID=M3Z1H6_MUSPF
MEPVQALVPWPAALAAPPSLLALSVDRWFPPSPLAPSAWLLEAHASHTGHRPCEPQPRHPGPARWKSQGLRAAFCGGQKIYDDGHLGVKKAFAHFSALPHGNSNKWSLHFCACILQSLRRVAPQA